MRRDGLMLLVLNGSRLIGQGVLTLLGLPRVVLGQYRTHGTFELARCAMNGLMDTACTVFDHHRLKANQSRFQGALKFV